MTDTSHGTGGLTFDNSKRSWPNEMNILLALIIIGVWEEAWASSVMPDD